MFGWGKNYDRKVELALRVEELATWDESSVNRDESGRFSEVAGAPADSGEYKTLTEEKRAKNDMAEAVNKANDKLKSILAVSDIMTDADDTSKFVSMMEKHSSPAFKKAKKLKKMTTELNQRSTCATIGRMVKTISKASLRVGVSEGSGKTKNRMRKLNSDWKAVHKSKGC